MIYKLSDCIEKIIDNRGRNPKYYDKEMYPVIDNVMIKNNYYPDIKESTRYIDKDTHDNFLRGYIEKDMPIMTLVGGGIGNVALAPNSDSVIVQNTIGFKTKDNILDSKYLYYWFISRKDEIVQFNRGSGQPSIRKTDIEGMNIELPSLDVQKRVSKLLSILDDKILLNNEINNNLYEIAASLINESFVNNDKIKLNELINFVKGKKPLDISAEYKEEYEKYLTIACLNNQETMYADPTKTLLTESDILMVMDGASSGDVYFSDKGIVGSTLSKIEICNEEYISEYVFFALKRLVKAIQEKTTGSAIPHTDKVFVGNLEIPKLDMEEQLKYKSLIAKIIQNNKQNIILGNLRDALLPKLMNGEIDLYNIEI